MRSQNIFVRLGTKKRVFGFTFLSSLLALLLGIASFSRSYSPGSLFDADAFHGEVNADAEWGAESEVGKIVDDVIKKIEKEVKRVRESSVELQGGVDDAALRNERVRHVAFLADIMGLVGSMRSLLPHVDLRIRQQQETGTGVVATAGAGRRPLSGSSEQADEAVEFFLVEEIRKYIRVKPWTFTSVGHACFSIKKELEEYMDYDMGDVCRDDWKLAQKLMVHGCDPLPRRRCFSRAPKLYTKPLPIYQSLWRLPDDRNVRWSQYRCKNFACLARNNSTGKGFFKCSDCFNLTHHETPRWVEPGYLDPTTNLTSDFLIEEVLKIKPEEIRIGLDFSAGTGTFAARMREFNVSIVTATINFRAPFSEMIALRGLVPLYLTVNQRLPFFDNTLDIIHTTRFLDGWIDFIFLDFVLYNWDRALRPGGLLWIDSFFCLKKDLNDYLDAFKMLRYRKHKWIVVPKLDKDDREVFFSAVLEKPPRPF